MTQNLWLAMLTCLAYCLNKELWKAIDYPKEQVRVLKEQQEKDRRILSSEDQLRYVLSEYLKYYHHERIHQGLNRIIEPQHEGNQGEIICIERLGGLLRSYHRKAA